MINKNNIDKDNNNINIIVNKLNNIKYSKHININRTQIINLLDEIKYVLYPTFFEDVHNINEYLTMKLLTIKKIMRNELGNLDNCEDIINTFVNELPNIRVSLEKDIEAYINSDPAVDSIEEIILSYPGLYAITVYRIAHELYKLGIKNIPRIMTEEAHAKTGIDIHPGATIGNYFFIDHGTGIVIGETTTIGDYVKIYQGVTLGALSINNAQELKGKKRHPTIGNHVTIYSGACILGGDTHIGDNVTIGCNAFVSKSIEDNKLIIDINETLQKNKRK